MPEFVEYEYPDGTWHTRQTLGDRIIETWEYWKATGIYPWPNAFSEAVSSDVEELLHLDGTFHAWLRYRPKDAITQ